MTEEERRESVKVPKPAAWVYLLIGGLAALIGLVFIHYFQEYGYWTRKALLAAAIFVAACVLSYAHAAIRKRRRSGA